MPYEVLTFANDAYSSGENYKIEIVSNCPICSEKSKPDVVLQTDLTRFEDRQVVVFQCQACYRFYLYEYMESFEVDTKTDAYITTRIEYPYSSGVAYDLPKDVEEISSRFKNIYQQAQTAEHLGLDEVAGMGYRKATEFLIKDYLILEKGKDSNEISQKLLGACIKLLDNEQIKSLAEATAWIGNDESHYTRKHEDRDIKDLKKFLHSIALFISYESTIKDAQQFTKKD